jgi:NitT/TauT family transport system permease protein/taurine transport system permease protein
MTAADTLRRGGAGALSRGGAVGIIPFVVLIAVWFAIPYVADVPFYALPPPGAVLSTFWTELASGRLWADVAASLGLLGAGFLIGNAIAIPLGIAIARSRLVSQLLQPVVVFMQSIAGIAWVPLAIIWFGLGVGSVLFVIVNTIFFANLYNVIAGVRSISPTLYRAVRSHGGHGWQLYRHLIVPGALLQVIVGLRTSMAYGWRALVAGEMIAGSQGIGFRTMEAVQWYQSDVVVLGMLIIGLLWLILDRILFVPLEARTVRRWGLIQR